MGYNRTWWLHRLAPVAFLIAVGHALVASAAPPLMASDALQALRLASAEPVAIAYSAATGAADFVSGAVPVSGDNPAMRARDFMARYGRLFGVRDAANELRLWRESGDASGMSHVAYEQTYNGVPVFGAQLVVHSDAAGRVVAANGHFQPGIALASVTPAISPDTARAAVGADIGITPEWQGEPRLVVWTHNAGGAAARLAWELIGTSANPLGRWHYFVDAQTGAIAYHLDELMADRYRATYTANNGTGLPGILRCTEAAQTCNDSDAQAAFDFAGAVYDYYQNNFNRDSFDGAGAALTSTVHYQINNHDAVWNGVEVIYGDANVITSTSPAQDLDLAAHEWTHALTQYTSDLFYEGQSGALNESYSDVFAVFITPANWLIGETSYKADLTYGLRSLADPTKGGQWNPDLPATSAGQPDRMAVIGVMPDQLDNGGVHVNSGIPNKAAYLLTNGGTFQGIAVSGIGFSKAQQIYYRTQTLYNTPFTNFAGAAHNTYQACRDLVGQFGIADGDCDSVVNAWAAVGVLAQRLYLPLVASTGGPPAPPTGIYGRVTEGGVAAPEVPLRLAQCPALSESRSCTAVISTTTDVNGNYRFTPASLPANQQYVVQYRQSATCSRLGEWNGNWIIPYAASDNRFGGDFDISAPVLVSPKDNVNGTTHTFQWTARALPPGMVADLPMLRIYDSSGTFPLYTQVYTRGATASGPITFFEVFRSYAWAVYPIGPQGVGNIAWACQKWFNITGALSEMGTQLALPTLRPQLSER